mmetsp:Transcript_26155/g.71726  ORF Transcript_26155/g.71726 Transcript_26155/m.71726 type:complete len:251 (-) Transcript_26155:386-1138(-)
MEEGCVHRSCYRRRGLLSFPPGTGPGPLTSPASSLRIDAASPPDFTAEVTIRANAHIPPSRSIPWLPPSFSVISATSFIVSGSMSTSNGFLRPVSLRNHESKLPSRSSFSSTRMAVPSSGSSTSISNAIRASMNRSLMASFSFSVSPSPWVSGWLLMAILRNFLLTSLYKDSFGIFNTLNGSFLLLVLRAFRESKTNHRTRNSWREGGIIVVAKAGRLRGSWCGMVLQRPCVLANESARTTLPVVVLKQR